jgi:thiamine pyrophosphokinase
VTPRHALVIADGSVAAPDAIERAWPGWSEDVDWVVAADGGARHADALGRTIDLWVGDGDSLGDDGVPIRRSLTDKDETDTELALLAALELGARRITILGGLGGERFDHALANVWLLDHPALAGRDVRLVDATARLRLIGPGRSAIHGRVGDLVSLLPFAGDALGVTTSGFRYPLAAEPLRSGPSRGLSNVREAPDAFVTVTDGRILVAEAPATLRA